MTANGAELPFRRIERPRVKDLALEQLKQYILSGAVDLGQRLPSERDLAELLGVGRNSIREALKVLETVGLIESRVGEGTFITSQPGASIGRTIGLSLAWWGGAIVEIHGARQIIEVETARVAAERADAADLRELAEQIERMEQAKEIKTYLAADMNFHRRLGQATHNAIVANISDQLISLLEEVLQEAHGDMLDLTTEGTATHRVVYEAVARRDGESASEAMRQHLQFSSELWRALTTLGSAEGVEPSLEGNTP
jgi:GntR family transcriptional regulator, transcriptional repressor for pyruvate dehydrogenase complex